MINKTLDIIEESIKNKRKSIILSLLQKNFPSHIYNNHNFEKILTLIGDPEKGNDYSEEDAIKQI